jgi:hypothetical protein
LRRCGHALVLRQIAAKALVAIPGVEIRNAEIRDFDLRGLSRQIPVPCRKISVSSSLKHPG